METPDRIRGVLPALRAEDLEQDHAKPELSAVQRVADELHGEARVPYPSGAAAGTCAVVVAEPGSATWIEVKLASSYLKETRPGAPGVPLRRQLIGPASGSTLSDVRERLDTLVGHGAAGRLGLLLIVRHSDALPLRSAELSQLEARSGLGDPPWRRLVDEEWPNPRSAACRIRAMYWERPA